MAFKMDQDVNAKRIRASVGIKHQHRNNKKAVFVTEKGIRNLSLYVGYMTAGIVQSV
jgi:hypothetical protein